MRFSSSALFAAVLLSFGPGLFGEPITVEADLRDAPRGLIHATLEIPAQPGPLTLLYARWIPGEHGPSGPVVDLGDLKLTSGGRALAWRRDLENMYALHVEVPPGASQVTASLNYLAPTGPNEGYSAGPTTSPQLAVLNWNLVMLYPQGPAADRIQTVPSVILPKGWGFGTSMEIAATRGTGSAFRPVTLEMLIDQPVITGAHFRHFELTPDTRPSHIIDCAADSEAALALSPARLRAFEHVPLEYAALMGIRHYETYHYLLALSDRTGYNRLEHHQCSDNRAPERSLVDDDAFLGFASLLTHEYFHSWNGKHRRPADLLSPDYQKPMRTDLLWVYEGLTEYYGDVMATRAGLLNPGQYEEYIAYVTASLSTQKGREWRPLQDTADMAQLLYYSSSGWNARRRSVDFYDEGELIWLEADVLIRARTGGAHSLDDFVRAFFGDGRTTPIDPAAVAGEKPTVIPYTADDIYAALNRILPYDWKAFFTRRLTATEPEPPMGGITGGGWRLVYSEAGNPFVVAFEKSDKRTNLKYSLGLTFDSETQEIADVIPGLPADRAGLGPNMRLIGINGRKYSDDGLRDALAGARPGQPIDFLVENADFLTTYRLNYSGGLRYPHLEKKSGQPDLLAAIVRPRAP